MLIKPVVLDLETQFTFQEVGYDPKKLKVSVVGLYDYATDKYEAYKEESFPQLFSVLEHASEIIGFNIDKFDLPVLSPYYVGNISQFATLDLLSEVERSLGFRVALDDLARSTLGEKKNGHGFMAIDFFRNGEWDKLIKYCLHDVEITKALYEYGKKEGKVYFQSVGGKRGIPVSFSARKNSQSTVSLSLPF
ncbi:ribonuclease H-like domain-containing protein [Patescibacteria group bacterium]|nr:ribonuclease H-like domain-containing protein [Patescibacteria group bacterium]MCL5797291.1 ribonuclease H-like domain-containing protein [Patescibacteria group bacterium]